LDLNEIIDVAFRIKPTKELTLKANQNEKENLKQRLLVWWCFQNENFPLFDCSGNGFNGKKLGSISHNNDNVTDVKTDILIPRSKRPFFQMRCD